MSRTLAGQQRAFCRALIDSEFPRSLFAEGAEGSLPTRLGIYRGAYRSRLAEALRANYPMLHLVLGDEDFARLAGEFIASCPSRRPSIRWFGERLEGFLTERQDLLPHPALLDLVRLEWALCLAFDAADLQILTPEDLAGARRRRLAAASPGTPSFCVAGCSELGGRADLAGIESRCQRADQSAG